MELKSPANQPPSDNNPPPSTQPPAANAIMAPGSIHLNNDVPRDLAIDDPFLADIDPTSAVPIAIKRTTPPLEQDPNVSAVCAPLPSDLIKPGKRYGRKYYVVTRGKMVGVFNLLSAAQDQQLGVSCALMSGFPRWEDAVDFYTVSYGNGHVHIVDGVSTRSLRGTERVDPAERKAGQVRQASPGALGNPIPVDNIPGASQFETPGRKGNPVWVISGLTPASPASTVSTTTPTRLQNIQAALEAVSASSSATSTPTAGPSKVNSTISADSTPIGAKYRKRRFVAVNSDDDDEDTITGRFVPV